MQSNKWRIINREKLATIFVMLLLFSNFIAFSSQKLAQFYDPKALIFNASLILIILILEVVKLTRADGLFILFISGFLALEVFAGNTSIGSTLNFLFIIVAITTFKYIRIEEGIWRAILLPCTISFIYIVSRSRNYWSLFELTDRGLITENRIFINPNTLSVFLMVFYIIFCLYLERKKVHHWWRWPLRIGILILNYLLKCRTGMMIFLLIMLCELLIPYKFWLSRNFAMFSYSIVLLFGIGFPRIFCIISSNEYINHFVHNLTGKFLFTGRERIWSNFYEYIDSHPMAYLFGVGTENVADIINNSSIHNSYLWIMSNCGIVGVLILFTFILWTISRAYHRGMNRLRVICVWGYLAVLLNFYTEATICYGFTSVILNMLLGLTNNDSLKRLGEENESDKSYNNHCLLQR